VTRPSLGFVVVVTGTHFTSLVLTACLGLPAERPLDPLVAALLDAQRYVFAFNSRQIV